MSITTQTLSESIKGIILKDIKIPQNHQYESDPFWQSLKATGTELWLDTGDLEEAGKIWTSDMTALTTNNTLLNTEIQKGIYDDFVATANKVIAELPLEERVVELAFILNARHGLKLVEKFGGKVSVELHTALSFDQEGIVEYGRRFHEIAPDHFIVKVPYTAEGLLGARKLRKIGIPVNFTLEFSARQNALVTSVVKPNYLNVFLGRLNAFVADNKLGSGENVGEKVTWASQKIVKELSSGNAVPTKQIAASIRSYSQLKDLAGIDVFTMPVKVATEGYQKLSGEFENKNNSDFEVEIFSDIDQPSLKLEKLWEVTDKEREFVLLLDRETPTTGKELIEIAHDMKCGDMFPWLSEEDKEHIVNDGKIPDYQRWSDRIKNNELAVDTLMNQAGLASFTLDQQAMDDRIRRLIS